MERFIQNLNQEQITALEAEGDVLLIACPGSGKTRALIYKLAAELEKIESHREFVVAITYTHVAAEEIRDRIEGMGVDTSHLWVGTIHSFCLNWILRPYSMYHESVKEGFGVIDIFDSEQLLDELAQQHPPLRSHYDCGYYATENGYEFDKNIKTEHVAPLKRVLEEYHKHLQKNGLIDYEMMLKYSHDLLMTHTPIARRLGQLFRLIAIDEYQDTRDIQYSIISKIVRASVGNTGLFMVGDPNQAIYGSLGGVAKTVDEIAELSQRQIRQLPLHQNYRSSQKIVDYFRHFADIPMPIEASGEWKDFPSTIVHDTSVSKADLVSEIAKLVRYNVEVLNIRPEEICIVAPWWMHLSPLTRSLVRELPGYEFDGPGLSPFGQNLDNFWYKVARIALTSASPDMFNKRIRWAREVIEELVSNGYMNDSFSARELLKITNGITVDEDRGTAFLAEFFDIFCIELDFRPAEGSELNGQYKGFFNRMNDRINDIHRREKVDVDHTDSFRKVFRPRHGITVSTIHGVKGAEFDTVIAFGLLEGIVPHFKEPSSNKESSAKKLLFVVGSRARKHLYLISESGRATRYSNYSPSNILRAVSRYPYTSRRIIDNA